MTIKQQALPLQAPRPPRAPTRPRIIINGQERKPPDTQPTPTAKESHTAPEKEPAP